MYNSNRRMPGPVTIGPSRVALVGTHDNAFVLCQLSRPSDANLTMAVASLDQHVGGTGTNYASAIRVALDLLAGVPFGYARHIYFAADGEDNREKDSLFTEVERAKRMAVRIYTVPIGCTQKGHTFNLDRLYQIAARTGGRIKTVTNLKQMEHYYVDLAAKGGHNLGQAVAKVLVADCSLSMKEEWDRTTKIGAEKFALLRFLQIEAKRQ